MRLIITEKNDASKQIANILSTGAPKADKVYNTPVMRFIWDGQECVSIGLRGHILEPNFVDKLIYKKRSGWIGQTEGLSDVKANIPDNLPKPPFKKKKPFLEDGVDLKGWKMQSLEYLTYSPIIKLNKEKDIIRSLKNLAKKADEIIIATDFDREGELIGKDALNCCLEVNENPIIYRARYSSFTKQEITSSFSNLCEIDENLASAGATRQDIDLIWGATLTRYLTLVRFAGYGNVRSSGRVQTPTLALICERERERKAFIPTPFWKIVGEFDASKQSGKTDITDEDENYIKAGHALNNFENEEEANSSFVAVKDATSGQVSAIDKKTRKVAPPVPFNTTSLMAAAASEGITPARCMRIAESLYMDGFISYPRVDNTVYPSTLDLKEIVVALKANPAYSPYCDKLLSQSKLSATRGKKETTDHPPIYPVKGATIDDMDASAFKLYNLIARRFLATLSDSATVEGTKVTIDVAGQQFVKKGDCLITPGFRAIYPYGLKKDEHLPKLEIGQIIAFNGATLEQDETKPPARYSSGKLIQEMEKLGLGTKATRHSIIERLNAVKYIVNDPIEPTQLGLAVIDAFDKFAPHITHPEMTAELESEMDDIVEGNNDRVSVVNNSRDHLLSELKNLIPHAEEVGEALSDAVSADAYVGKCPKCGHDLQLRASAKTKSMFIGCSGWPDCDVTYPLPKGKIESVDELCQVCGMPQIKVTAFRTKPRVMCIDPNCPSNAEPEVVVGKCPVCAALGKDSNLIARRNPSTLKRSITCTNFDECQTRYPLPPNGEISTTDEVCDACGAPIVCVTTARGPWRICPNFDCPKKAEEASNKKASKTKRASKKKK